MNKYLIIIRNQKMKYFTSQYIMISDDWRNALKKFYENHCHDVDGMEIAERMETLNSEDAIKLIESKIPGCEIIYFSKMPDCGSFINELDVIH